jgi:hypothetical protein
MHPSPTCGQPDPDRTIIILDGLRLRHRNNPDPIAFLPLCPGNFERVALPGIAFPQKFGQPSYAVFIAGA